MVTTTGVDYGVVLCDAITYDAVNEVWNPGGNKFYFMSKVVTPTRSYMPAVTPYLDGLSYDINLGERSTEVKIADAVMYENGGNSKVDMINTLSTFIGLHSKKGAAAIYVFVKNLDLGEYIHLSYYNKLSLPLRWLKGRVMKYEIKLENGQITVPILDIRESWTAYES